MSISTVRSIIEKPGCAIGCSAIMTVAIAVGLFQANCGDPRMSGSNEAPAIATVGDFRITPEAVERRYEMQRQMYSQMETLPPVLEVGLLGSAVRDLVSAAVLMQMAEQKGVAINPNNVSGPVESMWQQQVESVRQTFEMLGHIKPGASQKELEDAYRKQTGNNLQDQRQQFEEAVKTALEDPGRRDEVLAELSRPGLLATYGSNLPDAELRTLDDSWEFKRILIQGQDEAAMARARQALSEVRAGASFEQAMEKYSVEPAQPNKKVSENKQTLLKRIMYLTPAYQPLLRLKVGEISEPVVLPEGTAVYKLLQVKPGTPKDFEQKKAQYRQAFEQSYANARLQEELDRARKTAKIEWNSVAYRLLYEYAVLSQEPLGPTGKEREQRLREIDEAASKIDAIQDPGSLRIAALVRYAISSELYGPNPTPEMIQRRVEVIRALLEFNPTPQLSLELADLHIEQKDGERAAEQLLQAARSNHSFTMEGQQQYQLITEKLKLLQDEKLVQPDDVKAIEAELQRWRNDKLEAEKRQAEIRKMEEEAKKRAEADEKKLQEEAKKAQEAAKASQAAPPAAKTTGG